MDLVMSLQHLPAHQRRMTGFMLAAILLHSIVLIGLWDSGLGVRPELPDWMNIKLVAGLDESIYKETQAPPQKVVKQVKPVERVSEDAEQQKQDKPAEIEPQQAEAQHFVKANSRPFEQQNPKPFYPSAARRRGMQGLVLLQVEVNIRGKVGHIELKRSSGYRLLDDAAVSTVRLWQFVPARENDQPVKSMVEVPIKFELTRF